MAEGLAAVEVTIVTGSASKMVVSAAAVAVSVGAWGAVSGEWRYVQRVATYTDREITDFAWYQPVERVRGGEGAPIETSTSSRISADALGAAVRYAARMGSAGFIVVHEGRVVAESPPPGVGPARTNSMSMAKTILALLIGIAIEEGAIGSVDDPAARWLPEWSEGAKARISLRDLLEMSSGLVNDDDVEDPLSDLVRLYFAPRISPIALGLESVDAPGTRWEYNNFNSQILGEVLERATGVAYGRYLEEKLWRPLGAGDAYLWLDSPGGTARTYCCLFATPRDWARVGLLVLAKGSWEGRQIVPARWIAAMTKPSRLNPEYGLHIWLANDGLERAADRREPFLARDMVYLDGKHKQRVYVIPSAKVVIVRVGEPPRGWDDAFLPNTIVRGLVTGSSGG